jgi:hypothetical protein
MVWQLGRAEVPLMLVLAEDGGARRPVQHGLLGWLEGSLEPDADGRPSANVHGQTTQKYHTPSTDETEV